MKTHTRVVVIGGGIAGCSALYHLTQEGLTDCVLIERDELTSGTTWHSAAQVTNFGPNQTMIGLKTHSINLYKELAEDPDYPINYHHGTGGLRLASEEWHLDGYRHFVSMAKGMDVDFEIIDAEECERRHPLISTDNLMGALWDPLDGDIDPAQLCQALARRARNKGAEVYRHTNVIALDQNADKSWQVTTDNGGIHCEIIINAAGYRCNQVAALMENELPVASMEHQYLLTDPIQEIIDLGEDFRAPLIRCPTDDFYQRAEKQGLLIGFYEQDCKTWGLDGISPDFANALCPDDLERITDVMSGAIGRLPCLETAGIHTVINGPITYTPDGLPLVGKIPGFQNAYCITGLRAGLGEGGGHGWLLAQLIVHGEACYDTWCLDPRRFGRYANEHFTASKAIEDYQNEFRFHRPHEHRPAGRPARVTPLYQTFKAAGGHFTTVNGWERLDYIKPDDEFEEDTSFHFNNAHPVIDKEIRSLASGVGLTEINGFNRFEIRGSGATEFLDKIFCSKLPKTPGKLSLGYFLNHLGMVKGEATLLKWAEDHYWFGSAAGANRHDWDWLHQEAEKPETISIRDLTDEQTIILLAGPKSRDLLARCCPYDDLSKEALPWLRAKKIHIGPVPVTCLAVSFSGELAFELHMPVSQSQMAHDILMAEGKADAIAYFGMRAIESMRLEKGYLHWKSDLITEFDPFETGLDRFVALEKDFIGKNPLLERKEKGPHRCLKTLILADDKTPAHPGDSILSGDKVVGTVTSAGWGHRTAKNIAYAFIDANADLEKLTALVQDKKSATECATQPLYDPSGARIKA